MPIMKELETNVRLDVNYIGKEQEGKFSSKHGPSELAADVNNLCVKQHSTYRQWLDFLECQNTNWKQIPQGWERCVKKSNLKKQDIDSCRKSEEAKKLLIISFKNSQKKAAHGSPTLFINDTRYRGQKSQEALNKELCARQEIKQSAYCKNFVQPKPIQMKLVTDKRCKTAECSTKRFKSMILHMGSKATITEIDYGTEKGRQLFKMSNADRLPLVLIDQSLTTDSTTLKKMEHRLIRLDSGQFVYPIFHEFKPAWDPVVGRLVSREINSTVSNK